MRNIRRRAVVAVPAAAAAGAAAAPQRRASAQAAAAGFEAAERAILAGRAPIASGVTIDMPQLSENGNSVDLSVRVESPATAEDHVTAIHVLAEKNPYPLVASFGLSPRAGRAEVATRIRLSTTQAIVVLAETSRGRVHRASRDVIVVLGACVEGG